MAANRCRNRRFRRGHADHGADRPPADVHGLHELRRRGLHAHGAEGLRQPRPALRRRLHPVRALLLRVLGRDLLDSSGSPSPTTRAARRRWSSGSSPACCSAWRRCGSPAACCSASATQALVFTALGVLTNEPMHPVGIIALLLAAIVVVSSLVRERSSPYAMAALGALVAALVLVKINVGFFALVSVALAAAVSYPLLSSRRWPRVLVEAGLRRPPGAADARASSTKAGRATTRSTSPAPPRRSCSALRARQPRQRPNEELGWLIGGFLVLAAAPSAWRSSRAGTSVGGLIDGVIRQPLRQTDAFTIPMQISRRFYALDAACARRGRRLLVRRPPTRRRARPDLAGGDLAVQHRRRHRPRPLGFRQGAARSMPARSRASSSACSPSPGWR